MAYHDVGRPGNLILGVEQWVAYEIRANSDNPDKPKKIPINPHTGDEAKSNDASTWGDINEANSRACKISERADSKILGCGIGFMFGVPGKPSGVAGIDLDYCFNDDGTLKDYAAEIVKIMNSYTEYSPSKKGLHILFKLSKSLHEIDSSFNTGKKNTALGIEIYDSGRYFTVTGNEYFAGEHRYAEERTEQARQVIAKYFTKQAPAKKQEAQTQISYSRPDESDSELWEKMFNSQNGYKIRRLYDGDISDYNNDDSSADIALCMHLAYWTNRDLLRIDRMFRQTGLYRAKWERADYREATIQKAIARTPEYIPPAKAKQASTQKQPATQSQESSEPKPEIKFSFNANYLDSVFENDIKLFQRYSGRKTGFANLDYNFVLYPGLYVIGAMSSLGKTTFNLQLADNLAAMGEHVLFFAFEQTRFELVSKSLARLSQPEGALYESSPSAIEIRNGRITPELREAMQKYKELAGHYAIIECDFTYDVDAVISTVEEYIKQTGVKPVIFVDYLQLIRSNNPRLTNTKDIVDANIRALKLLQMRQELVMFVVSSINRENYLTTIDFQSFKESGSIEFTADVVLGLQLAVMNTTLFESDSKTTKKRKVVKAAKAETPRRLELCVLKNRYGQSSNSYFFSYYSKWDLFIPATMKDTIDAVKRLIAGIKDDEENDKPKKAK